MAIKKSDQHPIIKLEIIMSSRSHTFRPATGQQSRQMPWKVSDFFVAQRL